MDLSRWFDEHGDLFWGALIGVVATLIVGFIYWRLAEKPKKLGWEVTSRNRIIQATPTQREHLKVVYKSEEVTDPNIVVVRVSNAGKASIRAGDFPSPITIKFSQATVIAFDVSDKSGPDIEGGSIKPLSPDEPNTITYVPILLNRSEWIDIQFVTDGPLEEPEIKARFDGQSAPVIDLKRARRRRFRRASIVMALSLVAISVIGVFILHLGRPLLVGVVVVGVNLYMILFWLRTYGES